MELLLYTSESEKIYNDKFFKITKVLRDWCFGIILGVSILLPPKTTEKYMPNSVFAVLIQEYI